MTSALAHAPNCLTLTGLALLGELTVYIKKAGQARRVILPSKKGDPARRVTLLAEPTFCFSRSLHLVSHVNGSQSFGRKCMKSWLPPWEARSGWVTPLPCKRDLSSFYRFKWCGMTAPITFLQGSKTRIEHARHKLGSSDCCRDA